jgi:hypothetical protein
LTHLLTTRYRFGSDQGHSKSDQFCCWHYNREMPCSTQERIENLESRHVSVFPKMRLKS